MENQFQFLQNWTFEILESIKKDIKTDHLHTDPAFYRTYFGNRPQNRLTTTEIFSAYEKELLKGNQDLADWVVNRWVFKHGDLYQHFADRLSAINPDFVQIESLTLEESEQILDGTAASFGSVSTFLFALLNGVVFPKTVLDRLEKEAGLEREKRALDAKLEGEQQGFEKIIASQEREITRLNDKIAGVLKKYEKDTHNLKTQVKALQRKIHG
jgi:hypothetical protein